MRLLVCLLAAACADSGVKPTFPEDAAGKPIVSEQALLGISAAGDACVAQLIDADGQPPQLTLLGFDRAGGPTKTLATAPLPVAKSVGQRVREAGRRPTAILSAALSAEWPEAFDRAKELGCEPRAPAMSEPGRRRWAVSGTPALGSLPLTLRLVDTGDDPRSLVLYLSEVAGDDVELARMPLAGAAIAPELFIVRDVAWFVSGSVLEDRSLHRAVGVRRGSLSRGEAMLHDAHGLADYAVGDLDAARREFDRAIAADPGWVDALYNAASAAALSDRTEEAVAFLRRAAEADPGRVQVLGRNDEDLRILRKRADVRALLGLHRAPPDTVPPPP